MHATLYELAGPWEGRLAIVPRPRGGEWLEDDVRSLRTAGVDVIVSTLTAGERAELELADEAQLSGAAGIEYVAFPIDDRGVPSSAQATSELVQRMRSELDAGKAVAIHCRAGIGRSSILAAAILGTAGLDVNSAFQQIEQARGLSVPDTPEQRAWVERFTRETFDRPQRAAS